MAEAIPLSMPDITDAEVREVVDTLQSGRLSRGPRLERFEWLVARRTGRRHGIGVNSGTSALHLALMALGIGPDDEVIAPAYSFVATANSIEYLGAKPVFVDCDPKSLNLRAEDVEPQLTERTRAIVAMEVFGNPQGIPQLAALSTKYEIPFIEDCCEGLGGQIAGEPIGKFGRAAILSFSPALQITTGEGGMIVTDDDRLAETCRELRDHGRAPLPGTKDPMLGHQAMPNRLGFSMRMSELSAALGVAQMQRLNQLLEERQRVAEAYTRRLSGHADLILPTLQPDMFMSWFAYVIRLNDRFTLDDRDQIVAGLRRHDVGASEAFPPIPLLPHYQRKYGYRPGDFPVAESVSQRTIALPFFTRLTNHEVDLISQTLELMITRQTFARS